MAIMALVVVTTASFFAFRSPELQAPIWTVPYLSGAANSSLDDGWLVDPQDEIAYKNLSESERWDFSAEPADDPRRLVPYLANDYGFIFVVVAARVIFWSVGDLEAVALLQLITHLILCITVLQFLTKRWMAAAFVLIYAANPFIIRLVSFPFYYFWQSVAAVLGIWVIHSRDRFSTKTIGLTCVAALSTALIRSSTLPMAILAVVLVFRGRPRALALSGTLLFVAAIGVLPAASKSPSHAAYIGLGAYPNKHNIVMSDATGHDSFREETGYSFDFSLGSETYSPEVREAYDDHLRGKIGEVVKVDPALPIRNAVINLGQSFSIGHAIGVPFPVHLLVAVCGGLIMFSLLTLGQWRFVVLNLAATSAFVFYYPPIPAYFFGSYVILATGGILAIDRAILSRSCHSDRHHRDEQPRSAEIDLTSEGAALEQARGKPEPLPGALLSTKGSEGPDRRWLRNDF